MTARRKALRLGKAFLYPALLAHREAALRPFGAREGPRSAQGGSREQPSSGSEQPDSMGELRFHAPSSSG